MMKSALANPTILVAAAFVLGLVSASTPAAARSPAPPGDEELCERQPQRCGETPDYCERHRQECVNWYCDRHPENCDPPEPRGCARYEECPPEDPPIWGDVE